MVLEGPGDGEHSQTVAGVISPGATFAGLGWDVAPSRGGTIDGQFRVPTPITNRNISSVGMDRPM